MADITVHVEVSAPIAWAQARDIVEELRNIALSVAFGVRHTRALIETRKDSSFSTTSSICGAADHRQVCRPATRTRTTGSTSDF
jgi:hypothetical protein